MIHYNTVIGLWILQISIHIAWRAMWFLMTRLRKITKSVSQHSLSNWKPTNNGEQTEEECRSNGGENACHLWKINS